MKIIMALTLAVPVLVGMLALISHAIGGLANSKYFKRRSLLRELTDPRIRDLQLSTARRDNDFSRHAIARLETLLRETPARDLELHALLRLRMVDIATVAKAAEAAEETDDN